MRTSITLRVGSAALACIASFAACASEPEFAAPEITGVEPSVGPLSGRIIITVKGTGFAVDGAIPNRVAFGSTLVTLANTLNDSEIEVELPAGTVAEDVPVTVFNRNGLQTKAGVFRYVTGPSITSANPARILYNAETKVTVSGTGFAADGAGQPVVKVDGAVVGDVMVESDSRMSFTVGPGIALTNPKIEVSNGRGQTAAAPVQYVPTTGKGFLLFIKGVNTFARFFDPVAKTTVVIPSSATRPPTTRPGFRALFTRPDGKMFAFDRNERFGELDFSSQSIQVPVNSRGRFVAATQHLGETFVLERTGTIGKWNPDDQSFIVKRKVPELGDVGMGMTSLGNNLLVADYDSTVNATVLYTVRASDLAIIGSKTLSGTLHIADLRALDGVLYAATREGGLFTIDPNTGVAATVANIGVPVTAMEVFQ